MTKPGWYLLWCAISALGSLASIAAWLQITPEMVGETVYSALYILAPLIVFAFGVLFGYSAKSLMLFRRVRATQDQKGLWLTKPQANVVERMRRGERFERPTAYEDDILHQLERMGLVEKRGGFNVDVPGWRLIGG